MPSHKFTSQVLESCDVLLAGALDLGLDQHNITEYGLEYIPFWVRKKITFQLNISKLRSLHVEKNVSDARLFLTAV